MAAAAIPDPLEVIITGHSNKTCAGFTLQTRPWVDLFFLAARDETCSSVQGQGPGQHIEKMKKGENYSYQKEYHDKKIINHIIDFSVGADEDSDIIGIFTRTSPEEEWKRVNRFFDGNQATLESIIIHFSRERIADQHIKIYAIICRGGAAPTPPSGSGGGSDDEDDKDDLCGRLTAARAKEEAEKSLLGDFGLDGGSTPSVYKKPKKKSRMNKKSKKKHKKSKKKYKKQKKTKKNKKRRSKNI